MAENEQGSAKIQGQLWGARADDWAQHQETRQTEIYREAITRIGIGKGMEVLDIGCGSGVFAGLAAEQGANVSGIDAASSLIEIARKRVPEADFRVGDLQFLPYKDESFDVVTAFNSIQYAADPVAAAREAKQVGRLGAPFFVLVWGREEKTELVNVLRALRPLLPPAPEGAPGPFALSYEGALEALLGNAGLTTKEDGFLEAAFEYRDEDQLLRATLASGPGVMAVRTAGEDAVRAAVLDAVAPFRTTSGGYRLETEWRYVIGLT